MAMTEPQTTEQNTDNQDRPALVKVGERITIKRGTHRNKGGKVLASDNTKDEYAVQLDDGGLAVIWRGNVRDADEQTVSVRALAGAFRKAGFAHNQEVRTVLESVAPGISERLDTEE